MMPKVRGRIILPAPHARDISIEENGISQL
jgi:hypothetical protein